MVDDVLKAVVGDTRRFGALRERVQMLVEVQAEAWTGGPGDWLVTPLHRRPDGFYLVSGDPEGQRRGREVLQAFLGPALATLVSATPAPRDEEVDRLLQAAGLPHLSHVRLEANAAPEALLAGLEDAIATARTRDTRTYTRRPTHVELLRDLRLALLQRNAPVAERSLVDLESGGRLSFENLRFLRIELLGRLGRWIDLQRFPQLAELLRARRPRAINEILLEMIWRTELADLASGHSTPQEIYAAADLGARYGAILSAVDVPQSAPGRAVASIAALALGDDDRQHRLLAAADDAERRRLEQMAARAQLTSATSTVAETDLRTLFDEGQYTAVLTAFLERPDPANADLAVDAVLDSEDGVRAPAVHATVRTFIDAGTLRPSRRLSRDLAELENLVDNSCTSWVDWCARVGRDRRWADAAQVARAQCTHWESVQQLAPAQADEAISGLLSAWAGVNQPQIVAALDLLVIAATDATNQSGEFREAVLMILAEQENLSSGVRDAYLQLLEQLLENGPSANHYRELLQQATRIWQAVASPSAVDWAARLIDILLDAPSPDTDARASMTSGVIVKIHDFRQRISARQRAELDVLADEVGLTWLRLQEDEDEPDPIWNRLNGKLVGIYSLLPRATESFRKRLFLLCRPSAVEGNSDTKATTALRTLASRADYFVVDTWHATHPATGAIDDERPRDRQIMPKGRGVSAFLQAVEQYISEREATSP